MQSKRGIEKREDENRRKRIELLFGAWVECCAGEDATEILRVIQVLEKKGLDIVFGSRPTNNEMPLIKRVGNTGLYWIAYLLYKMKIKDT